MTIIIAIAAALVSGLLAILQRATDETPRGSLVVRLYRPYPNEAGLAWQGAHHILPFDMKGLLSYADDPKSEGTSPVMIYEDGKRLGPAHSNFAEISKLGQGRFAYWIGQGLIFSTSDGSDPNSNGRNYWAVIP